MSAPAVREGISQQASPPPSGSVRSRDGTPIGYRQRGRGPGLVVLHGTMSSGRNHTQLAELLVDTFTVTIPDRRGRGSSGPYGADHGLAGEVEDLVAVLERTGARRILGVSSGGIIALEAALSEAGIDKIAVFEPPLVADARWAAEALRRIDRDLAQGRLAAALVTAMQAAQMGPPIFRLIPRSLLELLTDRYMASQDRKGSDGYVPMRSLASTVRHDFALVAEMGGKVERFREVTSEVLLLGGSKSPAYLKAALDDLERVLPRATRVELPGLGHAALWNADVGGHPELVVHALRSFFR
jgi:pimeloyl-ACP methyl ester carboxylesterase